MHNIKEIHAAYLTKTSHHLLHEGPHGCDVDDFEIVHIDCAIHVYMLPNFSQHRHQGNVGFTSSLYTKHHQD